MNHSDRQVLTFDDTLHMHQAGAIRSGDVFGTGLHVMKPTKIPARFPHKVSIHNSCHGVRELFLSAPSELNIPYFNKLRDLLQMVEGIEVFEPSHMDECCGFGGFITS